MLMPKEIAKSAQASTALYKRAFSPGLLQGHIQLADKLTADSPFSKGAQTRFVKASAMDIRLPAAALTKATAGACPIEVAIPFSPR